MEIQTRLFEAITGTTCLWSYTYSHKQLIKPKLQTGLNLKPELGPSPTFMFKARYRLEVKFTEGVSQDLRNCRISKHVVYGYSSSCTVSSHAK